MPNPKLPGTLRELPEGRPTAATLATPIEAGGDVSAVMKFGWLPRVRFSTVNVLDLPKIGDCRKTCSRGCSLTAAK